jgi:hypothetical protein
MRSASSKKSISIVLACRDAFEIAAKNDRFRRYFRHECLQQIKKPIATMLSATLRSFHIIFEIKNPPSGSLVIGKNTEPRIRDFRLGSPRHTFVDPEAKKDLHTTIIL